MQHELNKGGFIRNGQMTIVAGSEKMQMSIYDFALKGIHNQYNTMAAGLAAVDHRYPQTKDPRGYSKF